MKREVRDCDYTGEKDVKNSIELKFETGREMDASGNGYTVAWELLDVSPRAAGVILNGLIKELSYEQQKILYLAIKTKEACHSVYGFKIITK